jgi:lysophospholipase L1-like esterase
MMKKLLLGMSLVFLGAFLSACGEDPNTEPIEERYFSILGDSYSTYRGYVSPETNDVWNYYDSIGVTSVEQMWWHKLAETLGWTLEKNNSFSGSLVCNMNHADYFGPHSFLRRMDDLGNPDIILIFGGTNDMWDSAPMGEYVYYGWTEEELCSFRPALACLFDGLHERYPGIELVFMVDTALGEEFVQSVHTIADYYGVRCVDLVGIQKSWQHPSAEGMATIAKQMAEALRENV